ncbi:aspartate-alanine antiporter-like transporter [Massiliimalia timonensis]|uniref:aspartate-alanine antiporter-like transporter n=1 Tax=Massiliimalia timonensis TaxID=1987501 RepID=UPI001E61DA3D|nr:permease [Massiliimalia timonensis]
MAADGIIVDISGSALKVIENVGLVLFVTSVGFIAAPTFFENLKQNFKSYIILGIIIILSGGLACLFCYFIGYGSESNPDEFVAILSGIFSGALTSTPAFSAAKASVAAEYESAVTVGYGIAYLFGVIGVVLFVQLIPKLVHADMKNEKEKILSQNTIKSERRKTFKKCISIDEFGLMPFALTVMLGIFVGNIKIPLSSAGFSGTTFSLTITGGALLVSLFIGHFGKIGPINMTVNPKVLDIFREMGLMFFLIGAGVAGGTKFIQYFKLIYFIYGVVITVIPMVIGYLFAKYVLKIGLLNNLGSVTGGMTSTPALGTLIHISKTNEVIAAYAATYPIALISVVLVVQFFIIFIR